MQSTLTIVIDSREKKPLPFPAHLVAVPCGAAERTFVIQVESATLKTADYILGEHGLDDKGVITTVEGAACLETKRSLREIAGNVASSAKCRNNFHAALKRMRDEYAHPLFVVEGGISTLYQPTDKLTPGPIVSDLIQAVLQHNIHIFCSDGKGHRHRTDLADFVLRFLIAGSRVGAGPSLLHKAAKACSEIPDTPSPAASSSVSSPAYASASSAPASRAARPRPTTSRAATPSGPRPRPLAPTPPPSGTITSGRLRSPSSPARLPQPPRVVTAIRRPTT